MFYASTAALLLAQAGVAQSLPPDAHTHPRYAKEPTAQADTRLADTRNETPDPTFDHRPPDLFSNPDCCGVDSSEILQTELPEHTTVNDEFLSDDVRPTLIISESTILVLSFIGEGAIYYNSLGYISYPLGTLDEITREQADTDGDGLVEPFELRDIPGVELGMIFAHASVIGGGGGLNPNEARVVGQRKFQPGTAVDFFLVQDGWNADRTVKDYLRDTGPDTLTFYTIDRFNPEPEPDARRHVAMMFADDQLDSVLFGFEDLHRTDRHRNPAGFVSDEDFNDNVFCVSTVELGALAQTRVPVATDQCAADIDENGLLDAIDAITFMPWFFAGDQRADINDDGTVEFIDLLDFLSLYAAGCN